MSLTLHQPLIHSSIKEKMALAQTATRGTGANVHDAMRDVLFYLRTEHGFSREELAEVLAASDSFAKRPDLTDSKEVERMVDGLFADGFTAKVTARKEARERGEIPPPTKTEAVTMEKTARWIANATADAESAFGYATEDHSPDLWTALSLIKKTSPLPIPEKPYQQFLAAAETLFQQNELLSLVTACNDQGKPIANDCTMYPTGWRRQLTRPNSVGGKGGVWWRHNPVKLKGGSGANGAVKDEDILTSRFLLLENDVLTIEEQAGVLVLLLTSEALPIRCIVDSGGKSLHALVEMCPETYATEATFTLGHLHNRYGYDKGNGNPSRMSRAPGFYRRLGVRPGSDGLQRLLYLSPPLLAPRYTKEGRAL